MTLPRALALLAALASAPAPADIVINGNFHVGDEDTRTEFTPLDPVDCDKYRSYPTLFHLSQAATITGFTMHNAIDLNNPTFTADVDGAQQSAVSCVACGLCTGTASCGDVTVSLATAVALSAGYHTFAVVDPSGASGNCNTGNDFGWSKLTLKSTATTSSVMLSQRRHAGDDDDSDDEYDFTGNVSTSSNQFYPDADEATAISTSFTLDSNQRLTQVDLSRLRDINTTSGNHGTVSVDGSLIGSLSGNGNPFTLTTGLLLTSGAHTLTVSSGTLSGQRDDISWDGVLLRFADTGTSGSVGFFNAVDSGETNPVTGKLRTKVAGGSATIKLYAMNGFGTGANGSYNGSATVDVLDASNSSGTTDIYGCNSSWTVAQSLSGSVTFSAGEATITPTFLDAGLKNARIRVTDSTTQARGCSVDNFAIRPDTFSVVPSHDTSSTAGLGTALTNTATSGSPHHKAGQPFTIVATARAANGNAATNYDGTPEITGVALAPATVSGTVTAGIWGAVSAGARRTDTATYSEVGAVTLTAKDPSWADVDSGDTAASVREITGTANAGRFTPDHFNVTDGTLAPGCPAGGFSYLGDTLNWATPALKLTAVNANTPNQTTLNYATSTGFESLPATLATPSYAALTGSIGEAVAGTPTISNTVAGEATLTLPALKFTRTRSAEFDAEIAVTLPAFADGDGIAPLTSPVVIGAASAGGVIGFAGGGRLQRFGRLYFEPTYGSERLPMQVPLRVEYFDGTTFVTNIADAGCTSLSTPDVTLTPLGGQTHAVASNGSGRWTVTLTPPNVPGQAGLSIDVAAPGETVPYPLLAADTDGDDAYDDDPAGTATFGLYSQDQRRIFQREVIGN